MENKASSLSVNKLNKFYGTVQAVKDFSINVKPGEFLVLLGPSGCGKTTALRMMAGLEATSSGQIIISEEDVTNLQPKYRDIAMVFQSYALYPHKTVAENIGFPFKVRGIKGKERDNAVKEAASQVRMEHLLDRYPKQLSGGERQRVALARAIVRRPAVFLMDEPLSNLDAKLRIYMRAELKRMQHELGITTVYVTHDQVEAMTLADRIVVLNNGKVMQFGTPHDLYNKPQNKFVAQFLGSPKMNFLDCIVKYKKIFVNQHSLRNHLSVKGISNSKSITVGIRPEHISVSSVTKANCDGVIELVEYLGSDVFIYVKCQERIVALRVDDKSNFKVGNKIYMSFSKKHMHFFDTNNNRVLI